MIINKLDPQGYCGGVKSALAAVYKALDSPFTPRPIYLLGSIIHNQYVIEDLTKRGAILIEQKGKTRLELLEQITEGTVVFSAHGVSPQVREQAIKKGLNILDTTCGNVQIIHKRIQNHLADGFQCLYIGTKHHPECEGILGMDSSILLIETLEDVVHLVLSTDKIYVTNQTTLSIYDTQRIYDALSKKFPTAVLDNKICVATTIRQEAILKQESTDLCLVVGDANSSNTKKLVLASQSVGIKTLLVENLAQVKSLDFTDIQSISITSGASTPKEIVDEIITYLSTNH